MSVPFLPPSVMRRHLLTILAVSGTLVCVVVVTHQFLPSAMPHRGTSMVGTRSATLPASAVETWDLSASHGIGQIPWPANSRNESSCLFAVDRRVRLRTADDRSVVCDVSTARAARSGDDLTFVTLALDKETAVATHEHALSLAKTFSIPRQRIDRWWDDVRLKGKWADAMLAVQHETEPNYEIEVHTSFNDAQPWFITLLVGWPAKAR